MSAFYSDDWLTIHGGDCRAVLREMPAESVHCVVTSPPYWGLRDYGTATWDGGDPECDHAPDKRGSRFATPVSSKQGSNAGSGTASKRDCDCGARRIDSQLGLEPTPEEYVAAMVDVFREVRRVLRADGTLWLNLGDSYSGGGSGQNFSAEHGSTANSTGPVGTFGHIRTQRNPADIGLKPKDLVGIPWRVAFALQADGWYLRSDIIWAKPNPMPESVTDRPTKSHEYLFLLSKSARYFFDADAVREPVLSPERLRERPNGESVVESKLRGFGSHAGTDAAGRNIRSVWTVATAPYPGAHFATFPPKLVEPCINAGTSERGVCPDCGAPWVRVVEREQLVPWEARKAAGADAGSLVVGHNASHGAGMSHTLGNRTQTTGWRPTCKHDAEPVPATVLDIFAGTGTVGMVAASLSRRAVLIDLNPDYLRQCLARNAQTPLGV